MSSGDFTSGYFKRFFFGGSGSRSMKGTFTLNGATPVTVANVNVPSACIIENTLAVGSASGTPGTRLITSVTKNVGFTVQGSAGDTNTYNYLIIPLV